MASVASTLERIKQDLRPFLPDESIKSACRKAGHRWRERKLGPVQTVHLFVLQVLCFNTAMTHLRHLSKAATAKASGYCKARKRLPLKVLQTLLAESARSMQEACCRPAPGRLWCGLRAYLVDGSSTIAPDTPDSQKVFGQPKGCRKGCGFPVPKVLGLFDAFSGLMIQAMGFPLYTHEQSKVRMLHPLLNAGDLLVGDRGFCSFVHLVMLFSRGVHGVFRIHQKTIVSFKPHRKHRLKYSKGKKAGGKPMPRSRFVKRLGKHDQIVEWFKSATSRPKWMSKEEFGLLPESLVVRELRFWIAAKGQRETHFGELKTTLRMRKVKSKTAQGVLKELAVYALVYNLVHCLMCRAAAAQGVEPHRVSFIDTVRWLLSATPGEALPALVINPHRPDRHEPRVVKDLQDTYTKMTRPRSELRKALKRQKVEA